MLGWTRIIGKYVEIKVRNGGGGDGKQEKEED